MESLRQEYCSGLSLPSPGDLPHLGVEPTSLPCREEECLNSLSLNHFVLAAKKAGRGRRLKGLLVARLYHWWDSTNPLFTPNSCFSLPGIPHTHSHAHMHMHTPTHLCAPVHTTPIHTHTPSCSHTDVHTFTHTSACTHTHTQRHLCTQMYTHLFKKNQPSI